MNKLIRRHGGALTLLQALAGMLAVGALGAARGAAQSTAPQSGTCARVQIQLNQQVAVTRTAFQATLTLGNSPANVPLQNVSVTLDIRGHQRQPGERPVRHLRPTRDRPQRRGRHRDARARGAGDGGLDDPAHAGRRADGRPRSTRSAARSITPRAASTSPCRCSPRRSKSSRTRCWNSTTSCSIRSTARTPSRTRRTPPCRSRWACSWTTPAGARRTA